MPGLTRAIESQHLLQRFLETDSESTAEDLLERLIDRHAVPLIKGVIARKVHISDRSRRTQGLDEMEAEHVHSLAVIQIIGHLRQARANRQSDAVRHFPAYVRLMTERAFGDFLDEKDPERRRLKQRVRYLLNHHPRLTAWPGSDGRTLCGLAGWKEEGRQPEQSQRLERLSSDPHAVAAEALPSENVPQTRLALLVYALLRWVRHPVELENLVSAIARIQGIGAPLALTVRNEEEDETSADPYEKVLDEGADVERTVQQKEFLRRLWAEICKMPARQRTVLLLHLRDGNGRSTLDLLSLLGITTMRKIAEALELAWEQFNALWKELPLEDRKIAELLGISPENVRFLRHSARARLAQCMQAWD